MWAARFESALKSMLSSDGHPTVKRVQTFKEAGFRSKPFGVDLEFVTGGRVLLQIVRASPPGGDDFSQDERVVEGDILPGVPRPDLSPAGSRLLTRDVKSYLTALITNSGNSEIRSVKPFGGKPENLGIDVEFHNGAHCYVHFLYTLQNGRDIGSHPEFIALEAV
ncbi:hypothetical protein [Sinosporangium siamense]|uniref:Uncharacterized protein n=1 Tax=Sinosporangium siamense TaxID=1367973 RepID=A0A919V513_9ACTN|nr:hypothetical protein [Sinosporangium siamense]GII90331.1 hypothetical protein Ssi02_05620 [Sinosporangium siamense]